MTADEFRRFALSFPGAEERSHMHHPDFRVGGKIFATLGYPDAAWAMVKLTPEQQHNYTTEYPDAFVPVKGSWGRGGATSVRLEAAKKTIVRSALADACANLAKKPARKSRGAV